MAAKLAVTDLPVEMDSTTLERMAAIVTVMDLPVEMLVKIFSFLDCKKLPNLFTVCSKFNAAAKDPSLWRRCESNFRGNDLRKVSSFCSFFSQYPFIRALSIYNFPSPRPIDYPSVNPFKHLFENLKHLTCLEFNMDLSNIVLPPSLRHFTCTVYYDVCKEDQFPFLDQCPKIERLHLDARYDSRLANAVRSVLLKYQLTLSALYLGIGYCEEEWIPLIENCLSLKEFGLELPIYEGVNLAMFLGSSLSSRLEHLHVNYIESLQSSDDFVFPELKVLTIETHGDLMDILPVIKIMPKLHSLRFSGKVSNPNAWDFCSVVKSCETLRYLFIKTPGFAFNAKDEFNTLIPELNEKSSEENQWKFRYEYTDYEAIASRKLNEGSSEEYQWKLSLAYSSANFFMPSSQCNCSNPTRISIGQNQQKQLLVLEIHNC